MFRSGSSAICLLNRERCWGKAAFVVITLMNTPIIYKNAGLFILFLFLQSFAYSQQSRSGNLYTHLDSIISQLPLADGNDYQLPSALQLTDWETLMDTLLAEKYAKTASQAASLGYRLIRFEDTVQAGHPVYYVLEETANDRFWGTYVFFPEACRKELVFQAPHPRADRTTGLEATYVFQKVKAFGLFISGAHRCNASASSSCSGTSSVCSGSSEPYRITDHAHNISSIFHQTTETIANTFPSTNFVQFHGFTKRSTDPYIIISNGTDLKPTNDPIVPLIQAIRTVDPSLTAKIAHVHLTWTRLRGFTNTQGRFLNQSTTPCTDDATLTTGRFLHIEQEYSKLREDATGWDKMATAFAQVYPCKATAISEGPSPIRLTISPNPAREAVKVTFQGPPGCAFLSLHDAVGRVVFRDKKACGDSHVLALAGLAEGLYILSVRTERGISGVGKLVIVD